MSNYNEEVEALAKEIKETMNNLDIKEKRAKEAMGKREKEKLYLSKRSIPIMIKIMKPLAKALMQKNKKIRDVNKKIKFYPPSGSYQKCMIDIPFGLHFIISLDYESSLFNLERIQYKNSRDIESSSSKKCAIDEYKLGEAAKELFLAYFREKLT